MDPIVILFVILAIGLIAVAAAGFKVVRPFQKGLIEFLGRYERPSTPVCAG
jgi:regulator of protease activity HflC (stomatin/prohibitin superfamily)